MKLSDFDFALPENLIATRPAVPRSASRLLVSHPDQPICDTQFNCLPDHLRAGDLLVMNDTKVIPARLFGHRIRVSAEGETHANMDVTLLGPTENGNRWSAMIKPLRKIRDGEKIVFSEQFSAELVGRNDGIATLEFNLEGADLDRALDTTGLMPLPPYIASKRAADAQDMEDYQTVWARARGAVAAPTASLHFDETVLGALEERGVQKAFVTLHVGAGTFLPVKTDDISDHKMHAEWGCVSPDAAQLIAATRAQGGRVIAVGTTALRLIETAARNGEVAPFSGETDIFIRPGHNWAVTDGLITNFHLPKSTLLMLVAALIGRERMFELYAHAIARGYRFFSYGDSSLLFPGSATS